MDDFDIDEYQETIRSNTTDELRSLLSQIGRNGETKTSAKRRAIIEEELQSRAEAAEAIPWTV